jgi:HlyD family secretion protein
VTLDFRRESADPFGAILASVRGVAMRTLLVALIGVVLFSVEIWDPNSRPLPTVSDDAVLVREVRRERNALIVERPAGATEGTLSSVFVVTDTDGVLRRVPVRYGRTSSSLIEVVSGLSYGDRIIVSDMRAWDQFERLRMRSR